MPRGDDRDFWSRFTCRQLPTTCDIHEPIVYDLDTAEGIVKLTPSRDWDKA
jgi:hypothetical protein